MVSDNTSDSATSLAYLFGARPSGLFPNEQSQVPNEDLESILIFVDASLDLFRRHEGRLSALEIRLRSMLAVVRAQIADRLTTADGDEAA